MGEWQPIQSAPERQVVETRIFDDQGERNVQALRRDGRLWWLPNGSMYVYYAPTHWRPVSSVGET